MNRLKLTSLKACFCVSARS